MLERRPTGCAPAARRPASTGTSMWSTAGSSIRTSAACSTCRRRDCSAGISSTMPAPRSRRCARRRVHDRRPAIERGSPRRMAGAAAAAHIRASWWRWRRRARSSGSTAGTMPRRARDRGRARRSRGARVAAAGADRRHAGATRTAKGFLRNFAGLVRRVFGVPIRTGERDAAGRTGGCGARRRHAAPMPRRASRPRSQAIARLGYRSAAAHPDHRLALSRRQVLAANGTPQLCLTRSRKWPRISAGHQANGRR